MAPPLVGFSRGMIVQRLQSAIYLLSRALNDKRSLASAQWLLNGRCNVEPCIHRLVWCVDSRNPDALSWLDPHS